MPEDLSFDPQNRRWVTPYCGEILSGIAFITKSSKPRNGIELHRLLGVMFRPTWKGCIPIKYGWFYEDKIGLLGLSYLFADGCIHRYAFNIPGGFWNGVDWYYYKMDNEYNIENLRSDITWYDYQRK